MYYSTKQFVCCVLILDEYLDLNEHSLFL